MTLNEGSNLMPLPKADGQQAAIEDGGVVLESQKEYFATKQQKCGQMLPGHPIVELDGAPASTDETCIDGAHGGQAGTP